MPEYTDTFTLPSGAGGMAAGMKHNRIKDRIMEFTHDTGINVEYRLESFKMILIFENKEDYAIYKLRKSDYFSQEKLLNIPGARFR